MTMTLMISSVLVYMLVFARLAAMLLFNPIFSRVNVPVMARIGIVLFLTLLVAPMQPTEMVEGMRELVYVFSLFKEIFIGIVYGFIFQVFYLMLFFVGDIMDTDFGISMAKTFDPATNIQASFSGTLLTMLFALYFFATGSHLAIMRVFVESFNLIPLGVEGLTVDIATFVVKLFSQVFMLALRLAAPFMVAEFILQAAMGILMKFIPQITVFVINFQLRIILGLILLFAFAPFIGQFIDNYLVILFDSLSSATTAMMGSP